MSDKYKLSAIGTAMRKDRKLTIFIQTEYIPALKYLSMYSHATLIYSDGSERPFRLAVVKFADVNEKAGIIVLDSDSRLQDGNVLYDLKPYIPCEDRITGSKIAIKPDRKSVMLAGGKMETILEKNSVIRKERGRYFLYTDNFSKLAAAINECSHIRVLWWFSRFDKKEYRKVTQSEPPYENAPRCGVLATRSPVRPNPIALTIAKILSIEPNQKRIEVSGMDCFDNTPLIDVLPYDDKEYSFDDYSVPKWLEHWPESKAINSVPAGKEITLHDTEDDLLRSLIPVDTDRAGTSFGLYMETDEERPFCNEIRIRGARQNNLKNLDLVIPKDKLVAVAGVSGSGKSSLAFDTLYAESRLRLAETADGLDKPDLDSVTGLPPAVAVAQRAIGRNPRSTVATFTGIGDRLRLLYAAVGHRHCPECGKEVRPKSRDEMLKLLRCLKDHSLEVKPYGKEEYRVCYVPGETVDWGICTDEFLEQGKGSFTIRIDGKEELLLQTNQMCCHCGTILFEISPSLFSFNNPESMCPVCNGLGKVTDIDPALVVARPELSLLDGASDYYGDMRSFIKNPTANWMRGELAALAEDQGVDLAKPWKELPESFHSKALYGDESKEIKWSYHNSKIGRSGNVERKVAGAIPTLERLIAKGGSTAELVAEKFVREFCCTNCGGERLDLEGRMVTVAGLRYPKAAMLTIDGLLDWLDKLPDQFSTCDLDAGAALLREIYRKARQLKEAGLSYLRLDRAIPTLSGGELQRLKLVAQMGIGLSGLLYIMDEPTAGLHPKDYQNILGILRKLQKEGNSVLMVEHEETMLAAADHLIEIGPGAGQHGGEVIWQGAPDAAAAADTQTARYLAGKERISIKRPPLPPEKEWVQVQGAKGNNLKNISVTFPKGRITCITGVSGSGKSTLSGMVIVPAFENLINRKPVSTFCNDISGAQGIKGVVYASQSAIGRNRRSIIATFMGLLDEIRTLFSNTEEAAAAGLKAEAFSFNSKNGQCDACKGEGIQTIQVPFAPDIQSVCTVCRGRRYKQEVLDVSYKGKSIFDVLEMTVEEARTFFESSKKSVSLLDTLYEVGLGYLKLGQGTSTLSGGEAQRIKLAKALGEKKSDALLYILDEPTTGLHFSDIQNLLLLTARLAEAGNTVLIIEHNRHVIRNADWIIDLGPESGKLGGQVVVQGTPEEIMKCQASYTGAAIR